METQDTDRWQAGTCVVVRSAESWADGLTGTVQHHTDRWPDRCTVKLNDGRLYLAFNAELRTARPVGRAA